MGRYWKVNAWTFSSINICLWKIINETRKCSNGIAYGKFYFWQAAQSFSAAWWISSSVQFYFLIFLSNHCDRSLTFTDDLTSLPSFTHSNIHPSLWHIVLSTRDRPIKTGQIVALYRSICADLRIRETLNYNYEHKILAVRLNFFSTKTVWKRVLQDICGLFIWSSGKPFLRKGFWEKDLKN